MSKVQIVKIPEEVCTNIQSLQYKLDARKELLTYMINSGVDVSNESFKSYNQEYEKEFAEYNAAKQELQSKYLEPVVPGKLANWNLNFSTAEVTCEIE